MASFFLTVIILSAVVMKFVLEKVFMVILDVGA